MSALKSQSDQSPRLTRHMSYIAKFTSNIQYIKGKFNVVANAISPFQLQFHLRKAQHLLCSWLRSSFSWSSSFWRDGSLSHSYHQSQVTRYSVWDIYSAVRYIHWCTEACFTKILDTLSFWPHPQSFSCRCTSHTSHQPTFCVARYETWDTQVVQIMSCLPSLKVHSPTRALLVERLLPNARFCSLYVDLVGPLPASQGMTYLFTIINHFTRWLEAIPIPDDHASTCATVLVYHWIARFGIPEEIISDCGKQFTSFLWTECNKLLGIETQHKHSLSAPSEWHGWALPSSTQGSHQAYTTSPD